MRPLAHVEPSLHVHAVAHELLDLLEELVGIEHDAVADGAAHAGMQDAARDLVEHELPPADRDGVPGVRPALVAHHPVGALGDDVDELPLPFIAPLSSDHHERTNGIAEHFAGEDEWGDAERRENSTNVRGLLVVKSESLTRHVRRDGRSARQERSA